jgi:molecular chaperone GrpE
MVKKETDTMEDGFGNGIDGDSLPPPDQDNEIEILEIEGMDEDSPGAAVSSGAPGTGSPGEDVPPDIPDQLEAMRREKEEAQERMLRRQADLENARKRLEREKEEFFKFAAADLIRKMLPVLDNLERAYSASVETEDEGLREGIRLVQQQFLDVLKKEGLEPVEALGKKFDPNEHEAVFREEVEDRETDEVTEVLQKGYFYRGRLLRPAMVKVAVRVAAGGETTGQEDESAAGGGKVPPDPAEEST